MFSEKGRPWMGSGTADKPPKFPWPEPPYKGASLFKISFQKPSEGAPTR